MRSAAASARASASLARWRRRRAPRRRGRTTARAATEDEARLAVEPRRDDAAQALRHLDRLEHARAARRGTGSPRRRPRRAARPAISLAASGCPSAAASASAVQVDAGHELDELGLVPAAEAGRDLDHLGPAAADAEPGVRRALVDPERLDRAPRHLDGRLRVTRGPDVRERDAERRLLGGDPVGDGERHEARRRPRSR